MNPTYTLVNGSLVATTTDTATTTYQLSDIQNGIADETQNVSAAQERLATWQALLAQYNTLNAS